MTDNHQETNNAANERIENLIESNTSNAVLIEEEPIYEFYARLCGITPKPALEQISALLPTKPSSIQNDEGVGIVEDYYMKIEHSTTSPQNNQQCSFISLYNNEIQNPCNLSSLALHSNNKGFQMLSSMGWKEEDGGLGKKRQGRMAPIATVLKIDKTGIGSLKQQQPKITHIFPNGVSTNITKKKKRKKLKTILDKEKQLEKRARLMVRSDIPVEYEELYFKLM